MHLVNNTPLNVAAVPNSEERDWMAVLLLACVTYHVEESGALRVADRQSPLLLEAGLPFPNDKQFVRSHVSVCVTGFVYPDRTGDARAEARLKVGRCDLRIR